MKELTLSAVDSNLDEVVDFINEILEKNNCTTYAMYELDIAVEELFVNIAHYAYVPEIGEVTIQASVENGYITIVFIDSGIPYNPWARKDPDTTLSLKARKVGGLGVYMVKNSMDKVDYAYVDGKNVVTIRKCIVNTKDAN